MTPDFNDKNQSEAQPGDPQRSATNVGPGGGKVRARRPSQKKNATFLAKNKNAILLSILLSTLLGIGGIISTPITAWVMHLWGPSESQGVKREEIRTESPQIKNGSNIAAPNERSPRKNAPISFHEGVPESGVIRFGPLTRIIPWSELQQRHLSLIGLGPQQPTHKGATQSSPLDVYVDDDNMYVDAVVTDSAGKVTLQIKKSAYVPVGGGLPTGWDLNHNDNVFEIVDETLVPVFRLIRRGRGEIQICGHFYADPADKSYIQMGCGKGEFAYPARFFLSKPA